jgi:hypothetical protein
MLQFRIGTGHLGRQKSLFLLRTIWGSQIGVGARGKEAMTLYGGALVEWEEHSRPSPRVSVEEEDFGKVSVLHVL